MKRKFCGALLLAVSALSLAAALALAAPAFVWNMRLGIIFSERYNGGSEVYNDFRDLNAEKAKKYNCFTNSLLTAYDAPRPSLYTVHYYSSPYDSEPSLVINEGDLIILAEDAFYGFDALPTCSAEWQYTRPFFLYDESEPEKIMIEDFDLDGTEGMYIRTDELVSFSEYKYVSFSDYKYFNETDARRLRFQFRDLTLFLSGKYISPLLFEPVLTAPVLCSLAACVLSLLAAYACTLELPGKRRTLASLCGVAFVLSAASCALNAVPAVEHNNMVRAEFEPSGAEYTLDAAELCELGLCDGWDFSRKVPHYKAPVDLHYYSSPYERSPALIIPKSKPVFRSHSGCYGNVTFPTDTLDFRYTVPFAETKEEYDAYSETLPGMYIPTDEVFACITEPESERPLSIYSLIRGSKAALYRFAFRATDIDKLYRGGVCIPPSMYETVFTAPTVLSALSCALLLASYILLRQRKFCI